MCLYPKIIENRRYKPNKKNGGIPPKPTDERMRAVTIGCGECIECRKKKAREWQVRLAEELKLKSEERAVFITLTIKPEIYEAFEIKEGNHNEKASKLIRLFTERWRGQEGKQPKRWLITELGHQQKNGEHIITDRLHMHGIIWTNKSKQEIEDIWQYGFVHVGDYVNEKTINYIIKYVTKPDEKHSGFKGKIFCSKKLGKGYMNTYDKTKNKFKDENTDETYRLKNGTKVALPIYLRNKIYSEKEREKLWIHKLNENTRYVLGKKIDVSTKEGIKNYRNALKEAQKRSKKMGFKNIKEWSYKKYEKERQYFKIEESATQIGLV